jgi:methionyl-tRNA formyltransferase
MNILLAAEEAAGLQVLKSLARSRHRVAAVLTSPPKDAAREAASLWNVAKDLGLETWPSRWVKDPATAERLRTEKIDLLLNVNSLYVIHRDLLGVPQWGAFNLHPGPLPRYAGLNSISWAIRNGERQHGVTVHKMEAEIDAGDIVYQAFFPITEDDTALTLSFKCTREGVGLMLKLVETVSTSPNELPLAPQDLNQREYFSGVVPDDGRISWEAPAENVVNFVRACDYFPFHSPWGCAKTSLRDRDLGVIKASRTRQIAAAPPGTVGSLSEFGALVASTDEWVLIKKLKIGDRYFAATDVLQPGDRLKTGNR